MFIKMRKGPGYVDGQRIRMHGTGPGLTTRNIDTGPVIAPGGLALHYDAGNPSSYNGGSTWIDLAGGNNLTLTNTTQDVDGGGSVSYDGTATSSVSNVTLSLGSGFTIELVAKHLLGGGQGAGDVIKFDGGGGWRGFTVGGGGYSWVGGAKSD